MGKKAIFSIFQFSIPNLIVIHLIECDSGPPANHDPLPDNIQGNCLLTPPTFHPINADNGFVEQFHMVFFPYISFSRILLSYFVPFIGQNFLRYDMFHQSDYLKVEIVNHPVFEILAEINHT